jgi:glycosyltransferase involved in cell wall biosynthesis
VEEGDIQAMARYMIELIRDPALATHLGSGAREHVSVNFSQEKSIATLWCILKGVLPRDGF